MSPKGDCTSYILAKEQIIPIDLIDGKKRFSVYVGHRNFRMKERFNLLPYPDFEFGQVVDAGVWRLGLAVATTYSY